MLGFRVWGLGFGVYGFRVLAYGRSLEAQGDGFRVGMTGCGVFAVEGFLLFPAAGGLWV